MNYQKYFENAFQICPHLDNLYQGRSEKEILPLNLNSTENQTLIKRLYANFVEETTELFEYVDTFQESPQLEEHLDGVLDELNDCTNFVTVLFLKIVGKEQIDSLYYPEVIHEPEITQHFSDPHKLSILLYKNIYYWGLVVNKLKNRPWKKSQYFIDNHEITLMTLKAYKNWINLISTLGFRQDLLIEAQNKKYTTNIERIKSNY